MLTDVLVRKFKSCKEVRLANLSEVAVFVGKNGVGKTNLMKAIRWAASTACSLSPISERNFVVGDVFFNIKLGNERFEYFIKTTSRPSDDGKAPVYLLFESLNVVAEDGVKRQIFGKSGDKLQVGEGEKLTSINAGQITPSAYAILSLLPEHETIPDLIKFLGFVNGVKYYPLTEEEDAYGESNGGAFLTSEKFDSWRAGASNLSQNELTIAKIISFHLDDPERLNELEDLLGPDGLAVIEKINVTVYDMPGAAGKVKAEQAQNKLYFVQFAPSMHHGEPTFWLSDLSFGTRRVTRLLVNILHDSAVLSLLEQPEDGVHPGLLYRILPTLRSYSTDTQIFITSHAAQVLNMAEPEELRLVEMNEGVTQVRELTTREVDAAHSFIEERGSFSDFVRALEE